MVSNASVLFPDPDGPVITVSARCGSSALIPRRLCCRALTMRIADWDIAVIRIAEPRCSGKFRESTPPGRDYLFPFMPRLLTPKFLVRGFEFSVLASLVGFGIILVYGNDFSAFLAVVGRLHWIWLLVGVGLASMDWIGGGLRNWVVARHVYPKPPLKGMILAGGMGAWG